MSEDRKIPEGYSFWWEPIAQRGGEMPMDMSEADKISFIKLRSLYGQAKQKIISRDIAVREKKQILFDYECYKFQEGMRDEWERVIRITERLRAEFRKNPTLDTAWKLVNAIEGRLPSEDRT